MPPSRGKKGGKANGPEQLAYEPIEFDENDQMTKDDKSTYNASHPVWDANSKEPRQLKAPKWLDYRFGPLPPAKSTSGKPATIKQLFRTTGSEREDRETEATWIQEAKRSAGRVKGSRALLNLKTQNLPRGVSQSYLGFPGGAAVSTFMFTEGQ